MFRSSNPEFFYDPDLPEEVAAEGIAKLDLAKAGKEMDSLFPTLTVLGSKVLEPRKDLECFPSPTGGDPSKPFTVRLHTDEFTCRCPVTGQPDFASITVEYSPKDWIAESKSWKLYLWSFRDERAFHEAVTNEIADFFMEKVKPVWCKVTSDFKPRGGIGIVVTTHRYSHELTEEDPR
jgi:7-cyano-7-deazaguanine reductase